MCMCLCVCVFIYSLIDGHLGQFHILAIVNIAFMTIGLHVTGMKSLGCMVLLFVLFFLINCHTVYLVHWSICSSLTGSQD